MLARLYWLLSPANPCDLPAMFNSLRSYWSRISAYTHEPYLLKMDDRNHLNQSEASHTLYLSAAQLGEAEQERERVMLLPSLMAPAPAADPAAAEPYFQQGKQLFGAGDIAGAVAAYRQAVALDESADHYQHLAQALSQQGDLAEAAGCYRKAIELTAVSDEAEPEPEPEPEPAAPIPWFEEAAFQLQQGQTHLHRKNWQAAAAACEQAVQIMSPKTAEAYSTLANALQAQGDLEAAQGYFAQALQLQPQTAELHAQMGGVYVEQKQFAEAMNSYRRAIALNPRYARVYWEMGELWKQMGDRSQATDCWYRALQLEPSWGSAREHWRLGTTLAEQNKLEQASQSYQQAIRLDPKFAEAYHNLGVILGKQGQWPEALNQHRQAVTLNPEAPQFWAGLGRALVAQEAWEEAIAAYQKVTKLNLEAGSYGIFQHALGQLELCQKAIVAQSYAHLAASLVQQQHWREAVDCYRQAIERYPNSAGQYAGLGKALAGLEQWPEAIAAYQQAMQLAPDSQDYYLAFGELLIQREQKQQTQKQQAVDPMHLDLKQRLRETEWVEESAKNGNLEADALTLL